VISKKIKTNPRCPNSFNCPSQCPQPFRRDQNSNHGMFLFSKMLKNESEPASFEFFIDAMRLHSIGLYFGKMLFIFLFQ